MKVKIILILLISVFHQCAERKITEKKVVILAENKYLFGDTISLRLYTDSTYDFRIKRLEYNGYKVEKYDGKYTIKNDTINFKPLGSIYIKSNIAVIKYRNIEYLNGNFPLKLEVTKTTFPLKDLITLKQKTDYSLFTFNHKFYNCFSSEDKPYDLNNQEVVELDSILYQCIKQNNKRISRSSIKYNKQCIAVRTQKKEIIVWINCLQKEYESPNEFKYGVIRVTDGGDSYFNLKVNLTKKECTELYVNGF